MILEVAQIDIREGKAPHFEEAMQQALELLSQSKGFRGARLFRSYEVRHRYRLLVKWDKVENHLVDWQMSEAFNSWRSLLLEYFVSIPSVEHMEMVISHP